MNKIHDVQSVQTDERALTLVVAGWIYRIPWAACSTTLAEATPSQRAHLVVSPSGYGVHWPELDEDLAIAPLLQVAESRVAAMAEAS